MGGGGGGGYGTAGTEAEDFALVGFEDFEAVAFEFEFVAGGWDFAEGMAEQTGDGGDGAGRAEHMHAFEIAAMGGGELCDVARHFLNHDLEQSTVDPHAAMALRQRNYADRQGHPASHHWPRRPFRTAGRRTRPIEAC